MADDRAVKVKAARAAAELLLKLSAELAEAPMLEARASLSDLGHDQFHGLVQLEIGGSMAIDRLLVCYLPQALAACEALPEPHRVKHFMQAVVNAITGGVMGFTHDMPLAMQRDFVRLLERCLTDAMTGRQKAGGKGRDARRIEPIVLTTTQARRVLGGLGKTKFWQLVREWRNPHLHVAWQNAGAGGRPRRRPRPGVR